METREGNVISPPDSITFASGGGSAPLLGRGPRTAGQAWCSPGDRTAGRHWRQLHPTENTPTVNPRQGAKAGMKYERL